MIAEATRTASRGASWLLRVEVARGARGCHLARRARNPRLLARVHEAIQRERAAYPRIHVQKRARGGVIGRALSLIPANATGEKRSPGQMPPRRPLRVAPRLGRGLRPSFFTYVYRGNQTSGFDRFRSA